MKGSWDQARDKGNSARIRRARAEQSRVGPRARLDRGSALLAVLGLLGLGLGGFGLAVAVDITGVFDPPLRRPLEDPRTLQNFRDSTAPIIGSAALADGEGQIALLRADGQLTLIDPVTGLLASDSVPPGLQSSLAGLSAGCGLIEPSESGCPLPDALFVQSRDGGLAERSASGSWRIVLTDAAWIGLAGTPVEQEEVSSWAASADGRWVAVLAGAQGAAIFDTGMNRWLVPADQAPLMAEGDLRLVADGSAFWVIGGQGLGRLDVRDDSAVLDWSPERNFTVRDLSLSPSGNRLAVVEGRCSSGSAPDCLRLAQLDPPFALRTLVGERERFSDLSSAGLLHAQMQGDAIVTLGSAGIHAYDPARRQWRQLRVGAIDAYYAAEAGTILATQGNTILRIANGDVTTSREAQGGPFVEVLLAGSRALGLSRNGDLRDLDSDAVLFAAPVDFPTGARFTTGASLGDRVLLASAEGLLLHDAALRRYQWFPAPSLTQAPVLVQPGTRIYATNRDFWAVGRDGTVARLVIADAVGAGIALSDSSRLQVPLRSVSVSSDGLILVDAAGVPWHANANSPLRSLTGQPRQGGQGQPQFAAEFGAGMVFADPDRLWLYDPTVRGWAGPFATPAGQRLAALTATDQVIGLTTAGEVWRSQEAGWGPVLTGGAATFDSDAVTDALVEGSQVFLGGQGRVQRYDLLESSFTGTWEGGGGAVRLVAAEGRVPVWLSDNRLLRGEVPMTDHSVRGAWLVEDGLLAEVAPVSGTRHTMFFPRSGPGPVCTRYSARPPEGALIDAIGLGAGRVLAATTGGLALHDAAFRRWLTVHAPRFAPGDRLYRTDGWLLVAGQSVLRTLPLGQFVPPGSCAEPIMAITSQTLFDATALSIDEGRGQVALLAPDGGVDIWADGAVSRVLAAPTPGPRADEILEIAAAGRLLLAATAQAIWSYDTATRVWSRSALSLAEAGGRIVDVGLSDLSADGAAVTAWTDAGRSVGGIYSVAAPDTPLADMSAPAFPRIATPADAIADVAQQSEIVAVTSAGQIELGRRSANALTGTLSLPAGLDPVPRSWGRSPLVLVSDAPGGGVLSLLPGEADLPASSGALAAAAFRYRAGDDRGAGMDATEPLLWRVARDGSILRCPIVGGQNEQSGCSEALPPPPALRVEEVVAAARAERLQIIATPGGLLSVDEGFRNPRAIAGPQVLPESHFLSGSGGLFFLEGEGRGLWQIEGARARRIAAGVRDASDWGGHLVVDAPDRPLVPATMTELTALAAQSPFVSFDWLGNRGFTLLDSEGRAIDGQGKPHLVLPLPQPETLVGALPDPRGQALWVQRRNGTLERLEVARCEQGPPHAPPQPCLAPSTARPVADRGFGALIGVSAQNGETLLTFDRGTIAVPDEGSPRADPTPPQRFRQLRRIDDSARIRGAIAPGPDGTSELAPPLVTGEIRVADRQIARLAPPMRRWDALSLDWLSWQREAGQFSVPAADGGQRLLTPAQLLRGGRPIQTLPGRGLRLQRATPEYRWLTPQGLWSFSAPGSPPALVSLIETPPPLALSAGRFLFAEGRNLEAASAALGTDPDQVTLTFGDLRIDEAPRGRRVTARLRRSDGSEVSAFAETGFAHDRRAGVGWRDGAPVVATPVGILPLSALDSADPLPSDFLPQRIITHAGAMHAQVRGGEWRRFDGGRWSPTSDPFADRFLAREDGILWEVRAGAGLVLSPEAAGQNWRLARQGLSFDLDQLISVAGRPGEVVLGTRLGTHVHAGAGSLAQAAPAQEPGPVAAPFDALSNAGGSTILFDGGAAPRVWDGGWRAPGGGSETPWLSRRAVEHPALRLTLARGAAPDFQRRIVRLDGSADWMPFRWTRGQSMPFDRAHAVFGMGDTLWIGTDFGLRRATGGLVQSDVYDISPAGSMTPTPVTRIGRPLAGPDRPIATGAANSCAELNPGARPGPCTGATSLAQQLIHVDQVWQWVVDNDRLTGRYLIDGSPSLTASLQTNGIWPHDALRASMVCSGQAFELWSEGEIVRAGSQLRRIPEGTGQGFLCKSARAELGGGLALMPGPYLVGSRTYALGTTGALVGLGDPRLSETLDERFAGLIPFDRGRLRIRIGRLQEGYQFRSLADRWQALPSAAGLPGIDVTTDFRHHPGGMDRLTPAGVVTHGISRTSLAIDPDALVLRFGADAESWRGCDPRHLFRLDGEEHGIAAAAGAPALLRCRDGSAVIETAPQSDFGAFTPLAEDPTASAVLIDRGPWRWERSGATTMSIAFRGEEIDLSAGRFPMDVLQGVAQVDSGTVDLVSAQGWWRHPASNLGANGAERDARVAAAREVRGLVVDRTPEGAPLLCLDLTELQLALSTPPRAVERCLRWQGRDSFWTYAEPRGAPPQASATSLNGLRLLRSLTEGRFADLVSTGAPRPLGETLAVPVRDGVLVLDDDRVMTGIYRFDGVLGLLPSLTAAAAPLAATDRGLLRLDPEGGPTNDNCPGLAEFLGARSLPPVRSLQRRGSSVQVTGEDAEGEPLAWSIECGRAVAEPLNAVVDVAARTRHVSRMQSLPEATRVLAFTSDGEQRFVVSDGRTRGLAFASADDGPLLGLYGRTGGRMVLAVHRNEVYEIDADAAITRLSRIRPVVAAPATEPPGSSPASAAPSQSPRPPVVSRPPPPAPGPTERREATAQTTPNRSPEASALVDLAGVSRDERLAVQRALERLGHYPGAIDGIIGRQSVAAIRAYQRATNAPATGTLTAEQFATLRAMGGR